MTENESVEKVNWVRGPKKANLSKVNIRKIVKAHEERGIEVEVPTAGKGKSRVIKTIVTGMPAPKRPEK